MPSLNDAMIFLLWTAMPLNASFELNVFSQRGVASVRLMAWMNPFLSVLFRMAPPSRTMFWQMTREVTCRSRGMRYFRGMGFMFRVLFCFVDVMRRVFWIVHAAVWVFVQLRVFPPMGA